MSEKKHGDIQTLIFDAVIEGEKLAQERGWTIESVAVSQSLLLWAQLDFAFSWHPLLRRPSATYATSLMTYPLKVWVDNLWLKLFIKEPEAVADYIFIDIQDSEAAHNKSSLIFKVSEHIKETRETMEHSSIDFGALPIGTLATLSVGLNEFRVRIEGYRFNAEGFAYQVNTLEGKFPYSEAWFKAEHLKDIVLP